SVADVSDPAGLAQALRAGGARKPRAPLVSGTAGARACHSEYFGAFGISMVASRGSRREGGFVDESRRPVGASPVTGAGQLAAAPPVVVVHGLWMPGAETAVL